ncbi:hypothetical protein JQK19_20745 [Chromobacterium violaceum]|uniref:hypothetical protein n=1 Tax=Chromobacterium violaceum TaxID=536 RepID=UPI001BEBF01A|nr:hypothetical protein [Chromobacterium violaceum]MBT2869662.1 hypothetical protein [Chromobacterium violaceum]
MLSRLLDIKRRRERGLRAEQARLDEDMARLAREWDDNRASQALARRRWREHADSSGVFDPPGLAKLRAELARLEAAHQALLARADAIAAERRLLESERLEQNARLRRNMREQEKFHCLLEDPEC